MAQIADAIGKEPHSRGINQVLSPTLDLARDLRHGRMEECYGEDPFRAAVEEAGVKSLMAAYNSVDGIPCSANRWLLADVLRNEWGFDGFVVSDCIQGATQRFAVQL